ncbi:hypothetical protein ACFUV2_33960 [Streptomyces pilosus]|uniref:hypothetical protein n=1 Tax=Streptomyces pilosus TaxID=28893 RepID=UPI0036357852
MKTRKSEEVRAEVEEASSRIFEIMALTGKTTNTRAATVRCSDYAEDEDVYRARHPWSVYNVPVPELRKAMTRLSEGLRKEGWTITKDGVDDSQAKAPQIVAESKGAEYSVDLRLLDQTKYSNNPSLIEVTVVSACYRSKQ